MRLIEKCIALFSTKMCIKSAPKNANSQIFGLVHNWSYCFEFTILGQSFIFNYYSKRKTI